MSSSNGDFNPQTAATNALNLTSWLIESIGARPSGSAASRQAADILQEEAGSFADRSWTEDFSVQPGAFLGWIRLLVLIYIIAVFCLWLKLFWPAALLTSIGLIILIAEFFFYRELVDPIFPRNFGRNVLATVEPLNEVRGQLIISGHHDSARIFNFLVHQPSLYAIRVTGGLVVYFLSSLTCWLLAIWTAASGSSPGWSPIAATIFTFLLLLVGQLWWFASAKSTPGAGDNLASSAAAWETLRHLAAEKASGHSLNHLRVIVASWDAEEAGLRGARAWVRSNKMNVPTWNLNLECLYDANELFFLTSDVNGTVQLSAEFAGQCREIMAAHGRQVPAKPIAFLTGGTDAGELARGGADATTLIGMPWGNTERSTVYHTPRDTPDAVSLEAVAEAIHLAVDLAADLDEILFAEPNKPLP